MNKINYGNTWSEVAYTNYRIELKCMSEKFKKYGRNHILYAIKYSLYSRSNATLTIGWLL